MVLEEMILATGNLHKITELRSLFKEFRKGLDLISLRSFPDYVSPDETGETFEENAKIKADSAAKHFNKYVLAEDSGIVVPSLNGRPGIYSARYAGDGATDRENRQKLLKDMEGLEGFDRQAYFECCIVIASPQNVEIVVKASCEGEIIHEERGRSGFGYDPIFRKHDYDLTFGQLDDMTKNRISHRRKSFEKLLIAMESKKL